MSRWWTAIAIYNFFIFNDAPTFCEWGYQPFISSLQRKFFFFFSTLLPEVEVLWSSSNATNLKLKIML